MTCKTSCDIFADLGNPWNTRKDQEKAFPKGDVVIPGKVDTVHHTKHPRLNSEGKVSLFHRVSTVETPEIVLSKHVEGDPEVDQHTLANKQTRKTSIFAKRPKYTFSSRSITEVQRTNHAVNMMKKVRFLAAIEEGRKK